MDLYLTSDEAMRTEITGDKQRGEKTDDTSGSHVRKDSNST